MLDYKTIIGLINVRRGTFRRISSNSLNWAYSFYENIQIVEIEGGYRVDEWVDDTDFDSPDWIPREYFSTEQEAIMYGLGLI